MRYSITLSVAALFFAVLAVVGVDAGETGICKWVDEAGGVHFAETCPEGVTGTEVEIQDPPSREQVGETTQRSSLLEETRKVQEQPADSTSEKTPQGGRSLPLEELGPLPENTTSIYLSTIGADYTFDLEKLSGQFYLGLQAKDSLPRGAYLEVHFPNPANADKQHVVGKELRHEGDDFRMVSPKSAGFKCWNYEVEVFVYADDSKDKLLDIHRQIIQSRIDLSLVNTSEELVTGLAGGGRCPSAYEREMKKMTVKQLESLCEREREKRLKPERESLIENCIKTEKKQAAWCENYFADWGDAERLDRYTMRPALYYNLPECIAAKKAREQARK